MPLSNIGPSNRFVHGDAAPPRLTDRVLRSAILDHSLFDPNDSNVKNDILQTVIQYLQDEGYHGSAMVVQDEANVKAKNFTTKRSQVRRMKRAIVDGDWPEVERLLTRTTFRNMMAFKYAVYRQQFLELVEAQETQKALSLLTHRLKQLEPHASTAEEFRDLCYLLTCKSVAEAPSFRDWDGVSASRTALVGQYSRLLEFDAFQRDGNAFANVTGNAAQGQTSDRPVPPGRLVSLLQQAVAFQILSSRQAPTTAPRIGTLLEDYEHVVVPNTRKARCVGHEGNVKCVAFVGHEGDVLASGSSDNTCRLWDPASGICRSVLSGHSSRIWDISTTVNGSLLASASGDGSVRLWNTAPVFTSIDHSVEDRDWSEEKYDHKGSVSNDDNDDGSQKSEVPCVAVLNDHGKDVYAVQFHAAGNALVTGGYDRSIRLYDVETQTVLKVLDGHRSAVSSVTFNALGNLVISGGKDSTIRFWDVISGLCVQTLNSHFGEITSVEADQSGSVLLSSSKDNSNRLWDLRTSRATHRFKGHQNTSANFIRAGFGPREAVVVGGSEDGFVYVWDVSTTEVKAKLGPANGAVYTGIWNARQSLLASCSHSGIVSTWCFADDRGKAKVVRHNV